MAKNNRVRITNISEQNLGFKKPHGFLLRARQEGPKSYMSSKVISKDQVDDSMEAWQKKGWLTIETYKEAEEKIEKAKQAKPPLVVKPAEKRAPQNNSPVFDDLADPDKDPDASDTVITKKKIAEDNKAKIERPHEIAQVPNIGSSLDGSPKVTDPEPTVDSPEAEGEGDSPEEEGDDAPPFLTGLLTRPFTKEDLGTMKMREIRSILDTRNVKVKSTSKEILIDAVLKSQNAATVIDG